MAETMDLVKAAAKAALLADLMDKLMDLCSDDQMGWYLAVMMEMLKATQMGFRNDHLMDILMDIQKGSQKALMELLMAPLLVCLTDKEMALMMDELMGCPNEILMEVQNETP